MLNTYEYKGKERDAIDAIQKAKVLSKPNNPLIKIDDIAKVKEEIVVKISECDYAAKSATTENTTKKYEKIVNELSECYDELNQKLNAGRKYINSLY